MLAMLRLNLSLIFLHHRTLILKVKTSIRPLLPYTNPLSNNINQPLQSLPLNLSISLLNNNSSNLLSTNNNLNINSLLNNNRLPQTPILTIQIRNKFHNSNSSNSSISIRSRLNNSLKVHQRERTKPTIRQLLRQKRKLNLQ